MSLSSLHLDAFFSAAQLLNFSQASKHLHITQSALSQRIKALEEDLGLRLFVRKPHGVELSVAGERLLRYCQARNSLEEELLDEITGQKKSGIGGQLRIAGYSSIVRSVLIPALNPLLVHNPRIQPHFQNVEIPSLPVMLTSGVVDFVVSDTEFHRREFECIQLGKEEYVLVQSKAARPECDVYLDHEPGDQTTQRFLSQQDDPVPPYRRAFMDEIYALIDAVGLGMGRAVVSKHLVVNHPDLEIVSGYKSMMVPVYLYYHQQPFYSELHKAVVQALVERCAGLLAT